jgi:hypothetical protein
MVSVYFDGELSSPWKEKMENHIAACASCSQQLETYKNNASSRVQDVLFEEAQQRVWQKLEQRGFNKRYTGPSVYKVWRRRLSVPVPAAAAAVVLVFITIALLWVIRSPETNRTQDMFIAAETEYIPEIFPDFGMENILQYISSRENGEIVILRLPESRNFTSYGEPAIIRAADYYRNEPRGRRQ